MRRFSLQDTPKLHILIHESFAEDECHGKLNRAAVLYLEDGSSTFFRNACTYTLKRQSCLCALCKVTGYGVDGRDSMPDRGKFSVLHGVQTASGAHPAPLKWVLEALSRGAGGSGRGVNLATHPTTIYTSIPPNVLTLPCLISYAKGQVHLAFTSSCI
jgi:hypothetical protein